MAGLDGAQIRRDTFTGGARGREGKDKKLRGSGEGSAAGRAREKDVFLVVPRRTNPNKHLLSGLDFLNGLDASNPPVWIFLG